jgi:hypothetical protein
MYAEANENAPERRLGAPDHGKVNRGTGLGIYKPLMLNVEAAGRSDNPPFPEGNTHQVSYSLDTCFED